MKRYYGIEKGDDGTFAQKLVKELLSRPKMNKRHLKDVDCSFHRDSNRCPHYQVSITWDCGCSQRWEWSFGHWSGQGGYPCDYHRCQ